MFFGHLFVGSKAMRVGKYELDLRHLVETESNYHDVFIDIGANFGYFSCIAAKHYRKVISVEPNIANFGMLLRNGFFAQEAGNACEMVLLCLGAGQSRTIRPFYGASGISSLIAGWDGARSVAGYCYIDALDRYSGLVSPADGAFIKIDVEGFEYECLLGMRSLLAELPRVVVVVEISVITHRESALGKATHIWSIQNVFTELGFEFFGTVADGSFSVLDLTTYIDRNGIRDADFVWRKNPQQHAVS